MVVADGVLVAEVGFKRPLGISLSLGDDPREQQSTVQPVGTPGGANPRTGDVKSLPPAKR